jgi:hypothetical protein
MPQDLAAIQFAVADVPAARHRNRLSVTSSLTAAPSDFSELFRYVRHADVSRFTTDRWKLLPALDGTHHDEYSELMRRRVDRF